jgi:ABC transporter fused permease/ATP-binding protein
MAWRDTEDLPKAKINKDTLSKTARIFTYFRPHRWKYFVGLIFLVLTSAVALVFPMLMGKLINAANADVLDKINEIALWLLLLFAAQAVFSFLRIYLFVDVTENVLATIRRESYAHLIRLPMVFFSQRRVGELNSRLSSDLVMLQDTFTTTLAEFLRQFILIVGGIVFLAFTSVKLTMVMVAVIPLVAIFAVVFGRAIRRISKATQDKIAESNTIVEETLQGIANVKSFANEYFESNRYNKSTQDILKAAMKGAVARGGFASFIIFCLFGSIIFVIWEGVTMVHNKELEIGTMFQFILYSVFVGASIGGIAEIYAQIQKAVGAIERVLEILNEEIEPVELLDKIPYKQAKLEGKVSFQNVKFRYPSRPEIEVLKNINFTASKGETIAIVGPSGSGKSTLASLLLRFYNPEEGQIVYDGILSTDYGISELRSQIAIVPQDVLLFGGTIKENIAYGKPHASDEEIKQAAKQANAFDFIESFPEKFETIVGERGIKLSGGQRQRIAIARAVLKNPAILILDEATSSLDSESERVVQEALEKLMVGRTSFVIAHRLSTIRNADKIMVIDKGMVVEQGNHDELVMKQDGLYRNLTRLQYDQLASLS